ncbi:MAG: outer membrane beta-barrel protein [Fluviicola sp.]
MKKFCLILFGLLPWLGMAQTNGTLSISGHLQSEHNFIPMATNDILYWNCAEPMWYRQFHYTTGLGLNYRFDNQFELSTGIRYSRKKEQLNGYGYFCGTTDCMIIAIAPRTRHYIEMPLLARYYFLPGKFKIHVESGWIGSYRVDNQYQESQNSWLLSAQSGVGVSYFVNRWQFGLGANYRLQIDLEDRNDFYVINPHAFGIEFKTAFSLNN